MLPDTLKQALLGRLSGIPICYPRGSQMQFNRTLETLLAFAVIGVLFGVVWTQVIDVEHPVQAAPPMELGPVGVTALTVEASGIALSVQAFGTLSPMRRVALAAEGAGRIVAISSKWKLGGAVQAGEVLLELEPAQVQLAVAMAKAQLVQAQAGAAAASAELEGATAIEKLAREALTVADRELRRIKDLLANNVASEQLIDQARTAKIAASNVVESAAAAMRRVEAAVVTAAAAVEVAQAGLGQAEDGLTRLSILAPFAGRFTMAPPEVGGLLGPGSATSQMLGELIETDRLLLVAQIHEDDLERLAIGQPAVVRFPSRTGLSRLGEVHNISALVDPMTRSLRIEVLVNNDGETAESSPRLPAGLFGQATIATGSLPAAIAIDRRHFVWLDGQPTAFVKGTLESGQVVAMPRTLVLGEAVGETFVVSAGLEPADTLLISPLDRLAPRSSGEFATIVELGALPADDVSQASNGASNGTGEEL
jgi:HlyD family secretion protein